MPKELDYPRKSFTQSLELAKAVDFLGGNTTVQNAAEKLGQSSKGGNFSALFSAAIKHRLIESKKGYVSNTDLYKQIKLSYTEDEKRNALRLSFLEPQVYKSIYDKFKGKELPAQMLDKILIREFNVASDIAPRVAKYFIEGASFTELLHGNKILPIEETSNSIVEANVIELIPNKNLPARQNENTYSSTKIDQDDFVVHIYGAGIESKIIINDEDDFLILDAMINKLRKKIKDKKVGEVSNT